jgi:hypothetical protein
MSDKKFRKKLLRAARGVPKSSAYRTVGRGKKADLGTTDQMKYDHLLEDKKLDRKNIKLARRKKKAARRRLIEPRVKKGRFGNRRKTAEYRDTILDKVRKNRVKKMERKVEKRRDDVVAGKGGTDAGRKAFAEKMAQVDAEKKTRREERKERLNKA